jgi:hypothetical protein
MKLDRLAETGNRKPRPSPWLDGGIRSRVGSGSPEAPARAQPSSVQARRTYQSVDL